MLLEVEVKTMSNTKRKRIAVSIVSKLTMLILTISIIPISILGIATYTTSRTSAIERFNDNNKSELDSVRLKFVFGIEEIYYTGIHFSLDNDVIDFLSNKNSRSALYAEQLSTVRKKLYSYRLVNGIDSMYIIGSDNTQYGFDRMSMIDDYKSFNVEFHDFLEMPDNFCWGNAQFHDNKYLVPMYRKLYDNNGEVRGILIINVKEEKIVESFQQYLKNGERYIVINDKNTVISSNYKQVIGKTIIDFQNAKNTDQLNIQSLEEEILGEESFTNSVFEEKNKLNFVCFTPMSVVNSSLEYILATTAMLCLVSLLVCLFTSYMISKSLSRPIVRIIQKLEEKRVSALTSTHETNVPEAPRLTNNYSELIELLKKTIDDVYEAQDGRRLAEIKSLEYQINPHFLYNTLSSVIWLCDEGDIANAIKITKALSMLFKISVNDNERIPLNSELEHVRNYLEIQCIRYPSKFDVMIDCDETTRAYLVPKLILQPLVENSIYHGIKELQGKGEIRISSYRDGQDLILEVRDNASGMDETKMNELNTFLHNRQQNSDNSFGIGVANVNNRIKLYYGEAYGLHYERDEIYVKALLRLKIQER
jgi:two-component system sensor histidine kinase YesM